MLLAYAPDRPEGDTANRIDLTAALTPQGQIDRQAYLDDPKPWGVVRRREDAPPRDAELIDTEAGWAFRRLGEEDDPIWMLDARVLRPGEYATLRRPDGSEQVFRVVNVEPV